MSTNQELGDKNTREMDEIAALTQELSNTFAEIQDNVINFAKENPVKTMGLSLLAGAIIAQLFRPRK